MKAAWFDSFGAARDVLQLGTMEDPVVAAGDVLVRVETTAVNPSDVKKRAGGFPNLLDDGPVIPHSDGAGTIIATGTEVPKSRIGERVFIYQAQYERSHGTAAQLIAIASERAPVLPEQASYEVGACIGIPIMTAHRCVTADGSVAGQWVLVTGGAGRVGYYAIQWAHYFGARVLATASNEADVALCRAAGAEHVVNHREPGWGRELLKHTQGNKVTRVIDVEFGANLAEILSCIRTGGIIASYSSTVVPEPTLPFRTMMFMDLTLRMVLVYAMPEEAKAQAVADTQLLLERELLKHRITHVLPFDQLVHSHELIEKGTAGCIVITT